MTTILSRLTGHEMVSAYVFGQRRTWTPLISEWALSLSQIFYGLTFLPTLPPDPSSGGTFALAISATPILAWIYGVWGIIGLVGFIGNTLAWLGLVYPRMRLRVASLAVAFGFWFALSTLLIVGGNLGGVPLFLCAVVLTSVNLRIAIRNGQIATNALQSIDR